jgi:hypothetical protein
VTRKKRWEETLGSALTGWNPDPNKCGTATRQEGPWSEFKDIAQPETKTYGSQSTVLLKMVKVMCYSLRSSRVSRLGIEAAASHAGLPPGPLGALLQCGTGVRTCRQVEEHHE